MPLINTPPEKSKFYDYFFSPNDFEKVKKVLCCIISVL